MRRMPSMRRPRRTACIVLLQLCLPVGGLFAQGTPAAEPSPDTLPAEAPKGAIITPLGWFPPPERSAPKPTLPDKVERAYRIDIHGPISQATYDIVKRKVIRCRAENAQLVVFDMDTPGGRSDAMGNIIDLIIQDLKDVYTVAYVRPEAISAGAIISLACTEIVMVPAGTIGDAMPIMIAGGKLVPIPKEERGKIESYARAKARVLAQRNGYPEPLCEGMITMTMEIWLLRKPDTGELRIVEADRWRNVPGSPDLDRDLTRTPPESGWEFVREIDGPESIVTLTTQEAVEVGLCRHTFVELDELASHYNVVGDIQVLQTTSVERVMAFLTSPAISGLLMMVGILAIYLELNSPGLGIPAIVAIIAFGILFGARYLTGLAQWWEMGLFVVGIALLAAEIFVIPGFGVAGISGILCCLVALFAMVMPNAPDELPLPSTALDWSLLRGGMVAFLIAAIGTIAGVMLIARYLPRVPVLNRLALAPANVDTSDSGYTEDSPLRRINPGDQGVVVAMCRPVGRVRFGDDIVDASAEGVIIEKGTRVKALRRAGNSIVVEEVTDA